MARMTSRTNPATSEDNAVDAKPKTRAGVLMSEKVPMTIGFSEDMEFTGRSVDPEGRPAARADFHGIVTAQMEDALLHCTEKMIAFTDREVPLTQLGKMPQEQSQSQSGRGSNEPRMARPNLRLSLRSSFVIAMPWESVARSILNSRSRSSSNESKRMRSWPTIDALATFMSPAREKSISMIVATTRRRHRNLILMMTETTTTRVVSNPGRPRNRADCNPDIGPRPTSVDERTPTPGRPAPTIQAGPIGRRQTNETKASEIPTMVLTQIHFNKGMRGRFGSGKENDKTDHRWSEFFGNVEAFRAKVPRREGPCSTPIGSQVMACFLTGQTLRVIQEPPPVGSPESTPARQYLKAWEKAYAWSNDKALQSDVITYDSYKDLVYAYGEEGHSVVFAQQHAAGQPISPGSAKAVQLNPKTGGMHFIDSNTIGLIDKKTGYRPTAAQPDDPYAKKKKPVKKPFKLPTMNVERRGWTGS